MNNFLKIMGSEYSCQTVESEEEIINNVFRDMFKKEIEIRMIYENFLKCITKNSDYKSIKINKQLFTNFLAYALNENPYVQIYNDYFYKIVDNCTGLESIRKIGLIIIQNANNNNQDNLKKEIYINHFDQFYLENQNNKLKKESIQLYLGSENTSDLNLNDENINNNKQNVSKKLNSEDLNSKGRTNSLEIKKYIPDFEIANSNRDIKYTLHNKTNSAVINSCYNYDFNNSNFKFNMKQNPNFISFLKKKELEDLNDKILSLISDVIEINTDCLSYAMKKIFSENSIENLHKSWNKNSKKLLLYEIHRNYTSLVEKICLFPTFNTDDTIIGQFQQNINTYQFIYNNWTRRNNSSKNVFLKNVNHENEKNNILDEEKINKKTFKKKLGEFFIVKEKLVTNFFELTEAQLSGNYLRNWLYENAKNYN